MKKFKLIVLLIILTRLVMAGGLQIRVKFPSFADSSLVLAHYYLSGIYADDTIKFDNNGEGVFKRDTLLPQGLYKLFRNSSNHFDFLLGEDQNIQISGKDFTPETIKIEGAAESHEFLNYMLFLKGLQTKRKEFSDKQKGSSPADSVAINGQIDALGEELHAYWKKKSSEYPNTFLAKFLMANYVPVPDVKTIPPEISQNDSLLLRYRFDFQKAHFFDYFDIRDERFLYTPLIKPKMETWFNNVLYPAYDSVKPYVMDLIEDVRPIKKVFQYVTSFLLNTSINSNIMGMDALFVDLAKKYYLSGQAFWADSTTLAKIRENVIFAEKNLIGLTAPELRLESIDGEIISLHEISASYTLLLIFEPNCSHCKVFVPQLHKEVYEPFHQKGLEVYAIYSMDNRSEWEQFVMKEGLTDWINVWDPQNRSRFKITYDARKTPGVYLLDKNKKIVAKKLSVDQIKNILTRELKG